MRFLRLRVKDMGVFRGEHEWSFDSSGGQLTAVTGGNGSGKTTLLGLLLGAIYRDVPTRGSLVNLAQSRDAYVELDVVNGQSWRIRQACDAVSKKSEAVIMNGDGSLALESAKIRDADTFIAEHFPPLDLVLASTFAAQGAGGFLDAKPGERKAILLRSLGTERLEGLASDARERARDARVITDSHAARIADERARCGDADETLAALVAAQEAAAVAEQELVAAQADLEAAREAKARAEAQQEAYLRAIGERGRLGSEIQEAEKRLADVEARIRNNRAVLGEGDKIRAAVERIAELEAQAAQARQDAAAAEQEAKSEWSTVSTHEEAMAGALARVAAAQDRAKRARERAKALDLVRVAAEQVPALRIADAAAATSKLTAEKRLEELRCRRLAGAEERIGGLRDGLILIRGWNRSIDRRTEAQVVAVNTLNDDDERVRVAEETPGLIADASAALDAARDRAAVASRTLADAEALAARLHDVEAAGADLEAALADKRAAATEATERRDKAREATARAEQLRERAHSSECEARRYELGIEQHRKDANKLKPLEGAETRLAELDPQAEELRTRIDRLQAELDTTPEPTRPSEPPSVAGWAAILKEAERHHRAALAAVTRAEEAHQRATEGVQRIAELEQELAAAGAELADWTRLGKDLGRDGLQAALIDAACGELTAIANDLLHEAFGPRWTVSFETQRSDAKGKRTLEGMIVRVIDTERGRDAPAETYSGGEKTILGEAVSLALSTLACRRSGVDRPTLVRDESGAALDADKAVAYVAMLRRAAEMIGADRCLLVSHSPDVQEMCDAKIGM